MQQFKAVGFFIQYLMQRLALLFFAACAAALASANNASISCSLTLVRVTAPDAIDPFIAMKAITVTLRNWITPFVVRVLLAQRRFA